MQNQFHPIIVYPQHLGIRHAIYAGNRKTLCGRDAGSWRWEPGEVQDIETVSCKRCRKSLGLRPR